MKYSAYIILFILFANCASAQQWPNFNHFIDADWHEEPHDYPPHCWFSDIHVNPDQNDGIAYLAFGLGHICHRDNCNTMFPDWPDYNPNFRAFTAALNEEGQVEQIFTFSHEPYPFGNQRWNNGNEWTSGNPRHSFINSEGIVVAVMNNSDNKSGALNYSTDQHLHFFDLTGQTVQPSIKIVEGSPLRYYAMGGVAPDDRDSTYLVFGQENRKDEPYGEFTSRIAALKKFDHDGELVWSKTYPNTRYLTEVIIAESGGYWLSGLSSQSLPCGVGRVIIRADDLGNELSRIFLPGACITSAITLIERATNEVIALGRGLRDVPAFDPAYPGAGSYFTSVVTFDSESQTLSEDNLKTYLENLSVEENGTALKTEDGYLIGGYHRKTFIEDDGEEVHQQRTMFLKLDENRDSVWTRFYTTGYGLNIAFQRTHVMADFKPTPDGGFVAVGWVRHDNLHHPVWGGQWSPLIMKVDEHGCLEPGCQYVGVDEMAIDMRGSLKAYPNPATNYLRVNLDIPQHAAQNGPVELVMHDLQGRVVYRQNHPELQFGEVSIDVSQFPSGLYTLHCTVNGVWVDGQKVMVE